MTSSSARSSLANSDSASTILRPKKYDNQGRIMI